jgi:Uma2 family endonuclease
MATATQPDFDWEAILADIITEDDQPVDSIPSSKQQRLLLTPLYDSWTPPPNEDEEVSAANAPRKFFADINVGVFSKPENNPLVPEMFLSLDVETPFDWKARLNRSHFVWHFGKPPDVVVEIVSNREGHELDTKLKRYAQMDVSYYVVYDPERLLSDDVLRVYERGFAGRRYRRRTDYQLPELKLSLTFWEGTFEDGTGEWLRWCDSDGNLIPTSAEKAAAATALAAQAETRAAQAESDNARLQAEIARLRAQLATLNIS